MTFNPWTFLFEILNFLVLAFILHRLLYRPLREAIDRRKAETVQAQAEAEQARKEAETTLAQLAAKLTEVDRERPSVLRQASEQIEADRAKRLAEVEVTAKGVYEHARRDADRMRQDTRAAIEGELVSLGPDVAGRLLRQASNRSLDAQLGASLAETVRHLSAAEREKVRTDCLTGDAAVESAGSLDQETAGYLTAAVRDLLGRDCEVKFDVNPSLIGGVRVRVGCNVWDATFAAQLDAAKGSPTEGGNGKPC